MPGEGPAPTLTRFPDAAAPGRRRPPDPSPPPGAVDAERWARVEALFERLLAYPADQREAYLFHVVPEDASLRAEVLALLRAEEQAGGFISGAVGAAAAQLEPEGAAAPLLEPGDRVGPFRILSELGRGGMGSVYLAERDDSEYRVRVAIKIIRGGPAGGDSIRRFRAERQILAGLDHPNVARLLDGGTTVEGLPWLALEYVDGRPIDEWCDRRRLSVDQRIDLFLEVCSAVEYAHGKLVVHRDLKPGNVLVTDEGVPKLLDFGIAKLLDPDGDDPNRTATHLRMMTPAYASPEQVRGEAVTTATDVYALGLLLYELLSGRPAQRVTSSDHWEVQRAVCEREPERPATVLTEEVAEARNTTSSHLSRALRGDLDHILEMALRKEPERRYPSVAAFADELRRYRQGRPVLARGSSLGYRAGKFVRRNTRSVAAGSVVALLFLGTVAFYTARLAGERNRARTEAARATEVAGFLADLFRQANPDLAPGPPATARDLLDRGAERIALDLQEDPRLRAEMLQVIGVAYQSLGEPLPSLPLLEEAAQIRREVGEPEPLWNALDALAVLYWNLGRQDDAEALHREALALARGPLADDPFARATSMNNLGKVLQAVGRFDEAGPLYDSALVLFREVHGPRHPTVATALSNQAQIVEFLQGYRPAEPILRQAVEVTRSLPGEERLNEDIFLANLAVNLISQGRTDEAEATLVEAVALARERFGDASPRVADKLLDLGLLSARRGDHAAAEGHLREALPVLAAARGERHPDIAYSLSDLASTVDRQGRTAEADSLHREAVALSREVLSGDDPYLARALNEYGIFLVRNGRAAAAVPVLSEALEVATRTLPEGQRFPAQIQGTLGQALIAAGRRGEGVQMLQTALPVLREAYGEEDPRVVAAVQALAAAGVSIPPPGPPGS